MILDFFRKSILEIVVFICGASFMILEIVGARILAPWFGSSAFIWTNLIGIILASLSLGYFLGGKIADKSPRYKTLSSIIFLSAIYILLIFLVKDYIFFSIKFFTKNLKLGSFLASLVFFSIPSILLGMISPFSIRLKIKNVDSSGSTAGNLYAISTGGSIFGTFLAGFFLIPTFGVKKIIIALSVFLFLCAFLALFPERKTNLPKKLFFIFLLFLPFFHFLNSKSISFFENLIYEGESQYQNILVIDKKEDERSVRFLLLDGLSNSAMYLEDDIPLEDELVFDYLKCFDIADYYIPNPKKVLMIGGGVYSYPRYYLKNHPETFVEAVEIDPKLTEIAKKFFAFREHPRLSIFHQDGRTFVQNSQEKYDIVFLDAFSGYTVPPQLTTLEFLKDLKRILRPEGIIVANFISSFDREEGKFIWAEYLTYKAVFEKVELLAVKDPQAPNLVQNIALLAFNSEPFSKKPQNEMADFCLPKKITKIPSLEGIPKFSDDFCPGDYYLANLQW